LWIFGLLTAGLPVGVFLPTIMVGSAFPLAGISAPPASAKRWQAPRMTVPARVRTADAGVPAKPGELERYVRAALAATVTALVAGKVTSEYVGSTFFSDIAPALLGVACGASATRAAGTDGSGRTGLLVRLLACVYALLGTAFSFVDEDAYTNLPLGPGVFLPYAASIAGVLLWTLPPRRRTVTAAPDA